MKHLVEAVFSAGLLEALAAVFWLGLLARVFVALAFGGMIIQRKKGNDE